MEQPVSQTYKHYFLETFLSILHSIDDGRHTI